AEAAEKQIRFCHFLCKAAATALRTNNPRFLQKFVSIRIHGFVQESKIYNVLSCPRSRFPLFSEDYWHVRFFGSLACLLPLQTVGLDPTRENTSLDSLKYK